MMRAAALLALAAPALGDCGTACTASESCCSDSTGWECCINQATFCVDPRGPFQTSTCCPRWTVGCTVGSVGCCDPARPWQLLGAPSNTTTRRPGQMRPRADSGHDFASAEAGSGLTAYALFAQTSGLHVLAVDAASGNVTARRKVSGPAEDYYSLFYGGSTRIFPWDPKGRRFVFADADFSQGSRFPMTVYTIDPATAQSTSTAVSGAAGYPVGMAWDQQQGQLVVATQTDAAATFFAVDADSGAARKLAEVQRGANEDSPSFYAAYLTLSANATAVRVGEQHATTGTGPGVQQTALSGGASASSFSQLPLAQGYGMPITAQPSPAGGFLSLAPAADGSLGAVQWTVGGTATELAPFGNAHTPTMPGRGVQTGQPLGYVADAVGAGIYAAMVVESHPNPVLPGATDKWALCWVPIAGGEAKHLPLNPGFLLGAETVSLAGLGIAAPTAH